MSATGDRRRGKAEAERTELPMIRETRFEGSHAGVDVLGVAARIAAAKARGPGLGISHGRQEVQHNGQLCRPLAFLEVEGLGAADRQERNNPWLRALTFYTETQIVCRRWLRAPATNMRRPFRSEGCQPAAED
jgi:hypothetical protein